MSMLQEFEFNTKVMGCTLDVSIIADELDEAKVQARYQGILKKAKEYEQRFSRFLPESELSTINSSGDTCTTVSDDFAEVFLVAQEVFTTTDGLFNPLLQVALLGYDADFELLKDKDTGTRKQNTLDYDTDFKAITCSRNGDTYSLCMNINQKLDFGAFLKGYVAQRMVDLCDEYTGVIVNLGGDLYTSGKDVEGDIFKFSIYNPIMHTDDLLIPLHNSAMATSGNYKRVWRHDGVRYSHIVASASRENPETDLVSATVLHKQGAFADAYATVAMTLSLVEAQTFLNKQGCQYVLITNQGKQIINL